MPPRLPGSLLFFFCALVCFGQKQPVTIEAVSAARQERNPELAWSADGRRCAWIEQNSVWLWDARSGVKEKVVDTAGPAGKAVKGPPAQAFDWENRRVREARLQWFPDATRLLLSEGGDLFVWEFEKKQWQQITATPDRERDPRLSPDGKRIAYRRDSDLYSIEIDSGKVIRLTNDGGPARWNGKPDWVYPEELELGRAFWWSPDSKHLAYLQFDVSRELVHPHVDLLPLRAVAEPQRYPKAGTPNADVRLGVVGAEGGATRWMDAGESRDTLLARVAWLPNSSGLAVQKLNRVQNRLDLLLADVETAASRLMLRETDPAWINLADVLEFLPQASQFVWASERTGFRHLYVYTLGGSLVRSLTAGDWEVSALCAVDAVNRYVYFTSTEAGPLERQLYRVRLDGGKRERLTGEQGVHEIAMAPVAAYLADAYSSLTSPSRRIMRAADGRELAVLREADLKPQQEYILPRTEIVEVKADDGAVLYARLIRPPGFAEGKKHPAIVFVYGGPHAQNVRNSWAGLTWEQALAQRGFIIWQLDNRGTAGRGHAWESKLYRRLGMQELEDQRRGVEHLVSMGFVDRDRIGIYGWSYGGFMTLYAMLHAPDLFRAGVAGAPVTDWRNYDTIYTERYLGLPEENPEGYRLSSPVHFAAKLKGALMLAHNLEDDNVLFQNTVQMVNALNEAGKQYELRLYPQKAHGVTGPARKHMLEAMTAFFEEKLR